MVLIDSPGAVSYSASIDPIVVSVTVFEIFDITAIRTDKQTYIHSGDFISVHCHALHWTDKNAITCNCKKVIVIVILICVIVHGLL